MTFVLILIFIFIIWPIIRVGWTIHRMRSQARKAYEEMYARATGDNREAQPSRKAGWSRPARAKAKKIDSSVGDYVAFEEIKVERTENRFSDGGSAPRSTVTEQQITDVEWEEVR